MTEPLKELQSICKGPELSKEEISKLNKAIAKSSHQIDTSQELIRCISGENRLKILLLLSQISELCVNDISAILDVSVSAISHQLRHLRDADLVEIRRCSQTIYYSLKQTELVKSILTSLNLY